uniref:DUF1907 domain-containing protein n=1 Tax=Clastoptera arizonana TaxID=38151 RepID=A0A1B6EDV6_9HEMI
MALKADSIKVEEKSLAQPPLNLIAKAINDGLTKDFEYVQAEVVDCPDLTKAPFHLAAEGLGGSETIVEFGGVPYLMPLVQRDKVYDLKDLIQIIGIDPVFVVGAGAGPHVYVQKNSELVTNISISKNNIINLSRIAKLKDEQLNNDFEVEILKEETRCSLLANLYTCQGKSSKVLKIHCKKRIGKNDFVSAVKQTLASTFKDQCIGMGGTFLITGSKAKQHVMPDFSKTPILNDDQVNEWLRFYEMGPPLVAVGTFVTKDPGLDLRLQHFHSFGTNESHPEAGHYHIDTNPDTVEYLAYLNTGSKVVRIDRPHETHQVGRD